LGYDTAYPDRIYMALLDISWRLPGRPKLGHVWNLSQPSVLLFTVISAHYII